MAGVVDTSVLYALLDELDPHHDRASDIVRGHVGIEVPPTILCETEMLVRKRAGRAVAVAILPQLLAQNPQIGVLGADVHPQALRIWRESRGISYADAHAIAGALLLDSDLLTLDDRQLAVWRTLRRRGRA